MGGRIRYTGVVTAPAAARCAHIVRYSHGKTVLHGAIEDANDQVMEPHSTDQVRESGCLPGPCSPDPATFLLYTGDTAKLTTELAITPNSTAAPHLMVVSRGEKGASCPTR